MDQVDAEGRLGERRGHGPPPCPRLAVETQAKQPGGLQDHSGGVSLEQGPAQLPPAERQRQRPEKRQRKAAQIQQGIALGGQLLPLGVEQPAQHAQPHGHAGKAHAVLPHGPLRQGEGPEGEENGQHAPAEQPQGQAIGQQGLARLGREEPRQGQHGVHQEQEDQVIQMVPVPELKKLPDGPGQPRPIHVALEQKPPDQIGRGPKDQGDGNAKHILAPQGLQGQVAPRVQKQRPGAHEKQRHGAPQQRAPKEIRRPRRRAKGPVEPAHGGGVDEHRAEDGDGPHQVQVQLTGLGWERHTVPSFLSFLGTWTKLRPALRPAAGACLSL